LSTELKSLYLLRHGKSSWDDPSVEDHDRPLAPRGTEAARRIGAYMSQRRFSPALVLCSSAARAIQTYEAVASVLGKANVVLVEDALYGTTPADLLNRLREIPEQAEPVLVVGHNPTLQELAMDLSGDGEPRSLARLREGLPTGGLAALSYVGRWADLGHGRAYLESLTVPRELPDAGPSRKAR